MQDAGRTDPVSLYPESWILYLSGMGIRVQDLLRIQYKPDGDSGVRHNLKGIMFT